MLKKMVCLLGILSLLIPGTVLAAQVDCDQVYCFSQEAFGEETLRGICITELPQGQLGAVMLGNRVLQSGDILTAQQLDQVTFVPVRSQEDATAVMSYLPIYESHVAPSATMTLSIRGKEDKGPVAEDSTLETYKNIPNQGALKATDPEGQAMTYTVLRQPRRGTVELGTDGSFTYTPKKNKVGVDSFTYTAADPAGNVSREATVTVRILKPAEGAQYTDTLETDCSFEAEWLRSTGLFTAESLGGEPCFQPEKLVTQGQFLAMVTELLQIPTQQTSQVQDAPRWLQPYLTAALRSGLTALWPQELEAEEPITGAQAAVMLQNALELPVTQEAAATGEEPAWYDRAISAMAENGVELTAEQHLTRAQAAELLYQVSQLSQDAPGMLALRAAQQ